MAEQSNPGPGRSTSEAAFNEVRKLIAHRNEEAHKAARKLRIARDRERLAQRRRADQL
jgi:hypothetical protein